MSSHLFAWDISKWFERFGTEYQNLVWTLRKFRHLIAARLGHDRAEKSSNLSSIVRCDSHPPGQLFLELSASKRALTGGGIKRVAFQLAKAAIETQLAVPVYIHQNALWRLDGGHICGEELTPLSGDTFLIIDEFWSLPDEQMSQVQVLKANGVNIGLCIHDMLPITPPLLPDRVSRRSQLPTLTHLIRDRRILRLRSVA